MIDDDLRTLHVRCGSDIRDTLTQAGFGGDFLEFSDPVCEGPVPDTPDLTTTRAAYLAASYGASKSLTATEIAAGLRDADQRLTASHHYDRVVLWFEHDSHDQFILARILARLAETTIPGRLELICIDHHPDVPRFNGLGQLGPAALAALWPSRAPVTQAQIAIGQAIWTALRQPDPAALQTIAQSGTPALPIAARALWRHLQELPGAADGLSLTQRIILMILSEGPQSIGRIFAAMVQGREPLVWMGDLGMLRTIERMALTDPPVLTIDPGEKPFPRLATITETGRQVLTGTTDYLSLRPAERSVGGVRIKAGQSAWRFDEAKRHVVRR
jgi:hypothetical protein